ncbi:DnaD and phage-associated domain-containing protein [Bacillus sp. 491mf]|uniref:DnaD domain-containing protein n=1 Tax=unclassified Bacillus (in: firmicutes) TaxID=185979 RepID=UPI0005598AC0|nr:MULTISPECIES: DnaD domain protein [unclassified Bacillus (in: firmicutes)]SFC81509.1 DnaD and phage-associated domain-containing protein [Bacillus sp. 491mf]
MAVYRNVQVNFWQDEFVLDLTPEERYFYIYLLTCSKTTQCGMYPLPQRLAEMETGYNRETVDKLLQRFIEYGKILYDAKTKELYIINWLRYNPITNPNVEKCVLRELKTVKSKQFVQMFLQKCLEEEMNIPLLVAHFGIPVETPEEEPESCGAEKEIEPGTNVFAFYEQNFGSLSPYTAEELTAWIEDLSEELVIKALQIAHENNKRTLAYVKGILRDWHGKGFTRVSEVEEAAVKFRKKGSSIVLETEQFLEECEEWKKNVPSEDELQKFLTEKGWRP